MTADRVIQIFNRHELTYAHKRTASLFCFSVFWRSYVHGRLKRLLGFGYDAGLTIGHGGVAETWLNEQNVAQQLSAQIISDSDRVIRATERASQLLDRYLVDLRLSEKNISVDPFRSLRFILQNFHKATISLGVFNAFYRFIGEGDQHQAFSSKIMKLIAAGRQKGAEAYTLTDGLLQKVALSTQPLLPFLTQTEMEKFISRRSFNKHMITELNKRRNGYLLLVDSKGECVLSDRRAIRKVVQEITITSVRKTSTLNGRSAVPGRVIGRARVKNQVHQITLPLRSIFITTMTTPDDIDTIQKCAAIVTDEGGVLCHAAITARELHKPCVIGTKIATKVFKNGDRVEVDATRGIVRKI